MELVKIKNAKKKRFAPELGRAAEEMFLKMAKKKYKFVKKSSLYQDIHGHFDVMIKFNDHPMANLKRIEIKSIKGFTKRGPKQSDWTFVEFKNVIGNRGWLYGEADFIAFETQDNFLVVDRKELVKFCEEKVNRKFWVKKQKEAKYKVYHRYDRPDEMVSLVKTSEMIQNCKTTIWRKDV